MKLENEERDAFPTVCHVSRHRFDATAFMLHVQAYGLAAVTFLSFFPSLFRHQERVSILFLVVALCFAWVKKINPYVRTPVDGPLMAFAGWVLVTIPFAVDPAYSFSEWRKLIAHVLVFYWAMFVLRLNGGSGPARKILFAVVLGSLALSILALQDFVGRGGSWKDRQVRAAALFSDYNWLTSYLVLVIPILLGWLLKQSNLAARALASVTLAISIVAQIAAYTRAGWIAHLTQALAFVVIARRQQLVIWFLLGAFLIGGAVFALSSIGYQQETVDPWTFSARVKTWNVGMQQVLAHPIVGVGFGNDTFSRVYAAEIEADKDKGPVEKVLPALHNTFAMVLMGSGVPALILFVWMIVRVIQELLAGIRISHLPLSGPMVFRISIALAVIGFVVRNCFDYMFAGSLATLFWILMATGLSLRALGGKTDRPAVSNLQERVVAQ